MIGLITSHFWCVNCQQIVPIQFSKALFHQTFKIIDGRLYQEGLATDDQVESRKRNWNLEIEQAPIFDN